MQRFDSDGVTLAYIDEGAGDPILLIHGFASNSTVNWRNTNWIRTLNNEGFRVLAIDNRGHGQSQKLYDTEQYGARIMAEDVRRLLDHLHIARADIVGFSMGARISAFFTLSYPERVRSVVFGGLGINMVRGVGAPGPIAAALEAPNAEDVKDDAARSFRVFAEQTKGDRRALGDNSLTCPDRAGATMLSQGLARIWPRSFRVRSSTKSPDATDGRLYPLIARENPPEQLATIRAPVLIAVGSDDVIAGSGADLERAGMSIERAHTLVVFIGKGAGDPCGILSPILRADLAAIRVRSFTKSPGAII